MVDREYAVSIEFACEVNQASIGNLNALVFILAEDFGDVWQIVGTQRHDFKRVPVAVVKKVGYATWVVAQKPGSFGDNWPAGVQWRGFWS